MTARLIRRFAQPLCYAAALALAKGVSLIMVPIVTNHLHPADYALVELLASVADVGGVLLGLGLADTLYRFSGATDANGRGATAEVVGLALAAAALFLVVGQSVVPALAAVLPERVDPLALRLLVVSLALTACIEVPFAWLRMTDRAGLYLTLAVGKAVAQAGLVILALTQGWGVTGVIAAAATADVLLSAALVTIQIRASGQRPRLCLALSRRLLRYGTPLTLAGVAGFVLGSCDRWFLMGNAEDLAHYALAGKFALATAMLMQPFDLWWYPRRLSVLARADGATRSAEMVGFGMALAVLAASAVALAGPLAIMWLTPLVYHGAIAYVPWLTLIAALHATASLVNVGCYAGRTGDRPMAVNAAAAAVALVGYWLLIPGWGVVGAIAATVAAQILRVTLFWWLGRSSAPILYPFARIGVLALAGIILVAALPRPEPGGLAVLVGGGGVVLLIGLALGLGLLPVAAALGRDARPAGGEARP